MSLLQIYVFSCLIAIFTRLALGHVNYEIGQLETLAYLKSQSYYY